MTYVVKIGMGSFTLAVAALVVACGGSAEIGGDRDPITAKDAKGTGGKAGESQASGGSSNPDDPVSSDGSGGGNAGGAPSLPSTPACGKGFSHEDPGGKVCRSTYKGTCFESDAEACACAGCAADCLIAESYPTQVSCPQAPNACAAGVPRSSAGDECDVVVKDLCFPSNEAACACAGCAPDKCVILESYPAQVRCQ